jgi:HSP20 family protein
LHSALRMSESGPVCPSLRRCDMADKKDLAPAIRAGDPLTFFRQMTGELDRLFDEPFLSFNWPAFKKLAAPTAWSPKVDVFEKDNRLVTRIDLPGLTKEDVKVEVTDGYLAMSGERKRETEEKKEDYFRCEREYGSFYRAVPLPEGVKLEDVKAIFANGVLEVSVPLPAEPASKVRKVEILEPGKAAAKTAA